jgi:hypothetical protein
MTRMLTFAGLLLALGVTASLAVAEMDKGRVPLKGTEGPDVSSKVEPLGTEGPDSRYVRAFVVRDTAGSPVR